MTRYAMFLRGINVGGVRIPMPRLREVLAELGCTNITTWLNTGNVTLDDPRPESTLKETCEKALTEAFGYEAYVLVRPADELTEIVATYPYPPASAFHRYVVFGGAVAEGEVRDALASVADRGDRQDEAVTNVGLDLMWRCPKGTSTTSPVARALATNRLKPLVTTRNLNTLEKMI